MSFEYLLSLHRHLVLACKNPCWDEYVHELCRRAGGHSFDDGEKRSICGMPRKKFDDTNSGAPGGHRLNANASP